MHVVELLEQVCGVFWGQLARLHTSLDNVIASGSPGNALADRFSRLTSPIHDATSLPGTDQHNKLFSLNVELQHAIAEICQLPGLSRFLLPPTFSDLEFAYLSACHTTVGDEESPDEVIRLAAAVQFVGSRSVIGTMWAVVDGQTNKITSTLYEHMVSESGHTRAALALHLTMKELKGIVPGDQRILYVHRGA